MNEINLNPHNKPTGLANAAIQHEKRDSLQEVTANENISTNESVFEISIGKGNDIRKITYTREDLLQHITPTQDTDAISSEQITQNVTLNLEELLKQEITPWDSSSTQQSKTLVAPSIEASDLALLTAKDLNLDISLKIGDDVIEIGSNSSAQIPGAFSSDNGNDTIIIGNNSKVNIDTQLDVDNSDDLLIVGNNSEVYLSGHVGTDTGNDVVILGNNSKLHIDGSVDTDNGNDTIILGNNSELWLTGSARVDNGDTTLLMGNNVHIKLSMNIDEDSLPSLLIFGKNTNSLLNEMRFLKSRFQRFKIGDSNLEEIVGNTLKKLKTFLEDFQKNHKNHGIKWQSPENSQLLGGLELTIHRYLGQRLLAIDVIKNYVRDKYSNSTQKVDHNENQKIR